MSDSDLIERRGIFLERLWPPNEAPSGWVSQVGGLPNLPPDWEWPRLHFEADEHEGSVASLDFLAQIRLGDLPDVPDRDLLPKAGALFFFALALTAEPLDEFGPDSWRVLYYPGDVSGFPPRQPPPDAGWFLDDTDYGRMPAAEFHDPDAPYKDLFPRCPIRPIAAPSWKRPAAAAYGPEDQQWRTLADKWPGSPPPHTSFQHVEDKMPYRVEDALLHLNFARNEWREGVLSFDDLFAQDYQLSEVSEVDKATTFKAYEDWLARVKKMARDLNARGRATALSDSERKSVLALTAENAARRKNLGANTFFYPKTAAVTSMGTLLHDCPEADAGLKDEVAAAHPGHVTACGSERHRMLGYSYEIQQDALVKDAVLLLELGSDIYGPRFMWWDMGNLTFSISRADLAALRFDRVIASIEGC
jgi:uncharacterized protein YwqG